MRLITTTRARRVNDAVRLGERLVSEGIVGQFYVVVGFALTYDVVAVSIVPTDSEREPRNHGSVYSHLRLVRIVFNDLTEAASYA